jgi:hydrogenase expression/formation protein HypC
MCLSIPARVISINGNMAIVSVGGTEYEASLQLVEDIEINDFVLLHTGFAIQKISEEDALEAFKLLRELSEIDANIRNNEESNN